MRTKNNFGHRASFSNWHGIFTNTLPAFFFRLRVLKENHRELGYFHARNHFTKTTQTYYIKILLWMYCAYWIDYFNSLFILQFLNLGWKIKLIKLFARFLSWLGSCTFIFGNVLKDTSLIIGQVDWPFPIMSRFDSKINQTNTRILYDNTIGKALVFARIYQSLVYGYF